MANFLLWNGTSSAVMGTGLMNEEYHRRCITGGGKFSSLILHVSPYLYPFSIEYSIVVGNYLKLNEIRWKNLQIVVVDVNYVIAVGIWFMVWQNIGKRDDDNQQSSSSSSGNEEDGRQRRRRRINNKLSSSKSFGSGNNLILYADCASANRGLFAGLIVMVATAVSIIIFFLAFTDDLYLQMVGLTWLVV